MGREVLGIFRDSSPPPHLSIFSPSPSPRSSSWKTPLRFPLARLMRLQLFTFSAQVFFRVVFKGASSCFLSGYLPGPDKEVRLPAVSAFTQRAAFTIARLTYTVKRLSQHWRSRLCVKGRGREGRGLENKWIYVPSLVLSFPVAGGTTLTRLSSVYFQPFRAPKTERAFCKPLRRSRERRLACDIN